MVISSHWDLKRQLPLYVIVGASAVFMFYLLAVLSIVVVLGVACAGVRGGAGRSPGTAFHQLFHF